MSNKLILGLLALATLGGIGCASVELPRDQIEHFEAEMRNAKGIRAFGETVPGEHVGAFGMSNAKVHLELATDQAEVAKTMAKGGDARAPLLLARAQSDAELAIGIAHQAEMHRRALAAADELTAARRAQGNSATASNDLSFGASR
jgi:hypothetical protein